MYSGQLLLGKFGILIIIAFLSCNFDIYGQTLGYKEGPDVTLTKYNPVPDLGYTYGLFYDFHLYKDFGMSTGLQYSFFKLGDFFVFSQDNYFPTYSSSSGGILFKVIELPIDLTFKISGKDSSDFQLFLTGGYSLCYIVKKQLIQEGVVLDNPQEVINSVFVDNFINYAKAGVELRLFPQDRLNFALGIQYKYLFVNNQQYGDINNWNIYVKTGFNLSKKR